MMRTSVIVCPDREGIALRALDLLIDGLRAGIGRRGEAHLALTGGSSAGALFGLLRTDPRARRLDWARVHVWQGDERFVPPGHPDSNWDGALRDWLSAPDGPGIPDGQLHPIPAAEAIAAGHDQAWAAARYADELEGRLPKRDGVPAFDVILLGVGTDGHILSTFPGSAATAESEVPVIGVAAPGHISPHVPRVTLAPYLLGAAGTVIVMVPGTAKADIVAMCVEGPYRPDLLPAQLAVRPNAVWLLEAVPASP